VESIKVSRDYILKQSEIYHELKTGSTATI
jgi:hypothetical protein